MCDITGYLHIHTVKNLQYRVGSTDSWYCNFYNYSCKSMYSAVLYISHDVSVLLTFVYCTNYRNGKSVSHSDGELFDNTLEFGWYIGDKATIRLAGHSFHNLKKILIYCKSQATHLSILNVRCTPRIVIFKECKKLPITSNVVDNSLQIEYSKLFYNEVSVFLTVYRLYNNVGIRCPRCNKYRIRP